MLNDDESHMAVGSHMREKRFQGFQTTGGSADTNIEDRGINSLPRYRLLSLLRTLVFRNPAVDCEVVHFILGVWLKTNIPFLHY